MLETGSILTAKQATPQVDHHPQCAEDEVIAESQARGAEVKRAGCIVRLPQPRGTPTSPPICGVHHPFQNEGMAGMDFLLLALSCESSKPIS